MRNEDVFNAFREKGIEVTVYQSPFKTIESVVIDTHSHDEQIRAEAIEELLKQVKKEEMWLFNVIGSNQDIKIAFGGIYAKAEQLKEQK